VKLTSQMAFTDFLYFEARASEDGRDVGAFAVHVDERRGHAAGTLKAAILPSRWAAFIRCIAFQNQLKTPLVLGAAPALLEGNLQVGFHANIRTFSTAVIGAPDIADILPMTEESLYVLGKKTGTTSISVFSADKHLIAVVDLEVSLDTASLHGKIAASTGSGNIRVSSANGQVVLSGEASDAVAARRAVEVATGVVSGKDSPVINAMKVAPSQQVMLKVRKSIEMRAAIWG
jgi:Pilus formation protein N terminal region/BON domain